MTKIKDIYGYIDELAPYSLQESYDNSGINIFLGDEEIKKAVIALDITSEVAEEAKREGAQLIITHHPVIFRPLKDLNAENIAVRLCRYGISAISAHTNFDSAKLNSILCERLGLAQKEPLAVENGVPMGIVCETEKEYSPSELAKLIKDRLGNTVVRYNDTGASSISKIAVCSGSGGSMLCDAISKGCLAFITGDVKHDVFIDAHNAGICVFDAGHFHTENIFCEYMQNILSERFPDVGFKTAQSGYDILSYEI